MVEVIIIVREVGRLKAEYSLKFSLPEIPKVGEYISINRPDVREPFGEDLVVRQVWWRLHHPETGGVVVEGREKTGSVNEIFVECDQAIGPYSSDRWLSMLEAAESRGVKVERFEAERFAVREGDMK